MANTRRETTLYANTSIPLTHISVHSLASVYKMRTKYVTTAVSFSKINKYIC